MKLQSVYAALAAAAVLATAGCSGQPAENEPTTPAEAVHDPAASHTVVVTDPSAPSITTAGSAFGESALKLEDGVVRAKPAAEDKGGTDMTAIFGTLVNTTNQDIEIDRFSTSLGSATYEIHAADDGAMRKQDSITVPANGALELSADGEHLMIMGYEPEIPAGTTIDIILELTPQQSVVISHVPVREMGPGSN